MNNFWLNRKDEFIEKDDWVYHKKKAVIIYNIVTSYGHNLYKQRLLPQKYVDQLIESGNYKILDGCLWFKGYNAKLLAWDLKEEKNVSRN
jgi:hypothetical protein